MLVQVERSVSCPMMARVSCPGRMGLFHNQLWEAFFAGSSSTPCTGGTSFTWNPHHVDEDNFRGKR